LFGICYFEFGICNTQQGHNSIDLHDYLLSFGTAGEFGRFRTTTPFQVARGDAVVVRSYRGLEIANVLCESTLGHAHFLPNTTLGKLLRRAAPDDLTRAENMRERSHQVFSTARQIVNDLNMPLEVLDAEMMLDGKQAILHYLSSQPFEERDLVSRLSRQFETQVCLHTLALPPDTEEDHADEGCGRPNCGQGADGHCSSCSSGGCSTCSTSTSDLQEVFAALREKMPQRTPLN
jgi:cell fate regulator YaaT (PSP1 superfamily)